MLPRHKCGTRKQVTGRTSLCISPCNRLFHSSENVDGFLHFFTADFSLKEHIFKGFGSPLSYALSAEAQHRIVLGARKITESQWTQCDLWDWLSSDLCAVGCTSIPSCLARKKALFRVFIAQSYSAVPFRRIAPKLCATCGAHHAKIMAEGRKKLWEDLPTFFDLPAWAELKNDI